MKAFLTRVKNRLSDAHHHHHYGSVLFLGWLTSFAAVFPSVIYPAHFFGTLAAAVTIAAPTMAHLYALRALLPLRHEKALKPNMLAALMSLSYLPAALICLSFARWQEALHLPFTGAVLALLSLGLLFPGLAPFMAYGIAAKFIRPHETGARLALALGVFIVAWVLAGFTAEVIASI